jgi:hypothetical protein
MERSTMLLMDKSTISMVILNSCVSLPEGIQKYSEYSFSECQSRLNSFDMINTYQDDLLQRSLHLSKLCNLLLFD